MEEKDKVTVVDTTPIEDKNNETTKKKATFLNFVSAITVFLSLALTMVTFIMDMLGYKNDQLQLGSIVQLLLFSIAITSGSAFVKNKPKWVRITFIVCAVVAVAFIATMMIIGYTELAKNGFVRS